MERLMLRSEFLDGFKVFLFNIKLVQATINNIYFYKN